MPTDRGRNPTDEGVEVIEVSSDPRDAALKNKPAPSFQRPKPVPLFQTVLTLTDFEDVVANPNAENMKANFWALNVDMIPSVKAVDTFMDAWLKRILESADFARKCARFLVVSEPKESLPDLELLFLAFSTQKLTTLLQDCDKVRGVSPVGERFVADRHHDKLFQILRCAPDHRVLRFCLQNVLSLERLLLPLSCEILAQARKRIPQTLTVSKMESDLAVMLRSFKKRPSSHGLDLSQSHELLSNSTTGPIEHYRDTPPWKNVTIGFAPFVVDRTLPDLSKDDRAAMSTVLARWFEKTSKMRTEVSLIDANISAGKKLSENIGTGGLDLSDCGKLLDSALLVATALAVLNSVAPPSESHDLSGIAQAIPRGALTEICIYDATQTLELAASALCWFGSQAPTPELLEKLAKLISTASKSFIQHILQNKFLKNLGVTYKSWVGSDHPLFPDAGGLMLRGAIRVAPNGTVPATSYIPASTPISAAVTATQPQSVSGQSSSIPISVPPPIVIPPTQPFTVPPPSVPVVPGLPGQLTMPPPAIPSNINISIKDDGPPVKVLRPDVLREHELYAEIHRLTAQKNELANRVEANRKASAELVTIIDRKSSETLQDALKRWSKNAREAKSMETELDKHSKGLEKLSRLAVELCQREQSEAHWLATQKVNLRQKLQIYRDLVFENTGSLTHHSMDDLSDVARELREHVDRLRALVSLATANAQPEHALQLQAILQSHVRRLAETESNIQLSATEIWLLFRDEVVPRFVLAQTLHRDIERKILDASAQLKARERQLTEFGQLYSDIELCSENL